MRKLKKWLHVHKFNDGSKFLFKLDYDAEGLEKPVFEKIIIRLKG